MLIYKVTNNVNGKVYIGQTSETLEKRRARHERESNCESRKTVKFHNALLKYGFNSFTWEVLRECSSQEELDFYEEYYINELNALDREKGYNLKHGGKLGGCYSEEAKEHMGEATKQKWQNPECAAKMLAGLKKGTEAWKQTAKQNRIQHICPTCGKQFETANWDSHIYCSIKCANANATQKEIALQNLQKAAEKNKEKYESEREIKLSLVKQWISENRECLQNIKWNNLEFISSLCDFLNVKDHRTVAKLFDVKSKKELVKKLIEISENIC